MDINVAVCDDEKTFREMLYNELSKIVMKNINFKIDLFESSKKLVNKIQSNHTYHIAFIDINLRENSLGTNVGVFIKQIDPEILLIYMSSYDKYFEDLAYAEPFAFLSKPITSEKLTETLNSALMRINYLQSHYLYRYKSKGVVNTINLKDVMYFESRHRIVIIYMKNQTTLTFYSKLDDVDQEVRKICPFFLRVSKSFFINNNYIKHCTKQKVCLIDNTLIKVTQKYKNEIISYIENYIQ